MHINSNKNIIEPHSCWGNFFNDSQYIEHRKSNFENQYR